MMLNDAEDVIHFTDQEQKSLRLKKEKLFKLAGGKVFKLFNIFNPKRF